MDGSSPGDPRGGNGEDEAFCPACNQSFPIDGVHCPNDGARLIKFSSKRDELIGRVLDGRYEIVAPLGKGGMGAVYRGLQVNVKREVAIKVVHPSIANERENAKRFLREVRLASQLNAPAIINVFDFGQSDGMLFLVMELLRGKPLAALIAQGPMPAANVIRIALQLADALEAAHAQGIIHRDLKPNNVFVLDNTDTIKVLDFGLAKSLADGHASAITSTHAMLGTPLYMAPEQIDNRVTDGRTDLYAVGCMIHEMLTGSPPFVDATTSAMFAKHLTEPPPPLPSSVPFRLRELVARLLAKSVDDRVGSAAELRELLRAVRSEMISGAVPALRIDDPTGPIQFPRDLPVPVPAPAPEPEPAPPPRAGVVAFVAITLTIIGIAIYFLIR